MKNEKECIELKERDFKLLMWMLDKLFEINNKQLPKLDLTKDKTFELMTENLNLSAWQSIALIISNFAIVTFMYFQVLPVFLTSNNLFMLSIIFYIIFAIGIGVSVYLGIYKPLRNLQRLKDYYNKMESIEAVVKTSFDKQLRKLNALALNIYLERILQQYDDEKLCTTSKVLVDAVKAMTEPLEQKKS